MSTDNIPEAKYVGEVSQLSSNAPTVRIVSRPEKCDCWKEPYNNALKKGQVAANTDIGSFKLWAHTVTSHMQMSASSSQSAGAISTYGAYGGSTSTQHHYQEVVTLNLWKSAEIPRQLISKDVEDAIKNFLEKITVTDSNVPQIIYCNGKLNDPGDGILQTMMDKYRAKFVGRDQKVVTTFHLFPSNSALDNLTTAVVHDDWFCFYKSKCMCCCFFCVLPFLGGCPKIQEHEINFSCTSNLTEQEINKIFVELSREE